MPTARRSATQTSSSCPTSVGVQRSLAALSAALGIHPLHFDELEHAPPLFAIPFCIGIGFFQPIEQAQHMRFPGLARGVGDLAPVQEGRDILEAEIQAVESVALGVGGPLAVGIGIDAAR